MRHHKNAGCEECTRTKMGMCLEWHISWQVGTEMWWVQAVCRMMVERLWLRISCWKFGEHTMINYQIKRGSDGCKPGGKIGSQCSNR